MLRFAKKFYCFKIHIPHKHSVEDCVFFCYTEKGIGKRDTKFGK